MGESRRTVLRQLGAGGALGLAMGGAGCGGMGPLGGGSPPTTQPPCGRPQGKLASMLPPSGGPYQRTETAGGTVYSYEGDGLEGGAFARYTNFDDDKLLFAVQQYSSASKAEAAAERLTTNTPAPKDLPLGVLRVREYLFLIEAETRGDVRNLATASPELMFECIDAKLIILTR